MSVNIGIFGELFSHNDICTYRQTKRFSHNAISARPNEKKERKKAKNKNEKKKNIHDAHKTFLFPLLFLTKRVFDIHFDDVVFLFVACG